MAEYPVRRILNFLCVAHWLDHLFMLLYATVVLALEQVFDLSYGELMMLSTPGFVLFGATAIPAGWLGDRWSARGMIAALFIGLGIAAVLTGLAQTPWQIMGGLALIGVAASIYHPVGIALIARCAPPERRGRELGINGIFGGFGIGGATFLAGTLSEWVSWRAAFIVPGVASILLGLAFLWFVRAVPEIARVRRPAGAAAVGWRELVPVMTLVVLVAVGAGIVFQTTQVAMPKVFETRLGFLGGDLERVGRWVASIYLVGAAGQLVGGWVADRVPLRRALLALFAAQAILLVMAADAQGWPLFAIAFVLVTTTLGIQPIIDSLLAAGVPAHLHGRAYGVRFVASLATSAAGIPLVAAIYEGTGGFFWLFAVLAIAAAVSAAVTLGFLLLGRSRQPHPSTGSG